MSTKKIPATQNKDLGFAGAMGNRAKVTWPIAMTTIAAATLAGMAVVGPLAYVCLLYTSPSPRD